MPDEISRRQFVKQTMVGTAALASVSAGALEAAAAPVDPRKQVVAALGSLFIPSGPGDPGYKELESYGITDHVMNDFQAAEAVEVFNTAARQFLDGKTFLELDEKQREQYLALIVDGKAITDAEQRSRLQAFYRGARTRIL